MSPDHTWRRSLLDPPATDRYPLYLVFALIQETRMNGNGVMCSRARCIPNLNILIQSKESARLHSGAQEPLEGVHFVLVLSSIWRRGPSTTTKPLLNLISEFHPERMEKNPCLISICRMICKGSPKGLGFKTLLWPKGV